MTHRAKVLIVAAPRSGTMFMAFLLQALGLDVRHEAMGHDGAVSWREQKGKPFKIRAGLPVKVQRPGPEGVLDSIDAYEWIPVEFEHVFHQVRNPLHAIASIRRLQGPAWRYAANRVEIPNGCSSTLRRAMYLWHHWNQRCWSEAEWSYRIESIDEVFDELCSRLDIPPLRSILRGMPRNINSRDHGTVGWLDLFTEDPAMARTIVEQATLYGYEPRLEDTFPVGREHARPDEG